MNFKDSKKKRKPGRPSKFEDISIDMNQIETLAAMGLTANEMSDFLGICQDTFYRWIKIHDEFSEAIKRGRIKADTKVIEALYKRATGYEHDEDKIFFHEGEPVVVPTTKHYPPDTAAAFIWLKNRRGWKDKVEMKAEVTETPAIDFSKLSTEKLKLLKALLEEAKPDKKEDK